MSDLLAAAAAAIGAPEAIVKRSAEARAKATGTSIDDVLAAWAGGGSVATAAPPEAPAAEPEGEAPAAPPAEVEAPAPVEPSPEPAAPAAPQPEEVPVAAAVVLEPEEEPVEAAPIRRRISLSGRVGAAAGLVVALMILLVGAPWLLPRATLAGEEGALAPALEVVPGWLVGGHALLGLVVGMVLGALARTLTGWLDRGMRLVSSFVTTLAAGGVVGALVGLLVSGVVAGSGEPLEGTEGVVVVPLLAAVLWTLGGWTVGGWAIGGLVQAFGVPAGVDVEEAEEVGSVRHRLVGAIGIPVAAVAAILLFVLPIAYLFISFPVYAPLLGVLVAGGILGFAGLAASRPGMRISIGELLVAAAGIGVVVVIIVAVLTAQGAGHAEGEGEAEEAPPEAAVVLHQA